MGSVLGHTLTIHISGILIVNFVLETWVEWNPYETGHVHIVHPEMWTPVQVVYIYAYTNKETKINFNMMS